MKILQVLKKCLRGVLALVAGLLLPLPGMAEDDQGIELTPAHPRVREVLAIHREAAPHFMAVPDVLGTAVGLDAEGQVAMVVYVNVQGAKAADAVGRLPRSHKGARVAVEFTEPIRALAKGAPLAAVSHTALQTPPIQLGTSGGWGYDLANRYCCGGTLGSLITKNGKQYILSNYHVFESDIVPGGNNRQAQTGDNIIQPGLIDVGCNLAYAQAVATLVKSSSLPGSNVDASIAEVIPGMVRADGAILEIGTISAQTIPAAIGQKVKKSGRTSRLTRSTVSGLNATISVQYDNECAGGVAFTKTYTGQVIISNRRSSFLAAGDSGSLMVQDVTTNPKAVGLLFAGSNTLAVANPIDDVLAFFGATMVGN